MKQLMIMALQAAAILVPTWLMHIADPEISLAGLLFTNFVVVAFMTGLITHLLDRLRLRRSAVGHVEKPESNRVTTGTVSRAAGQFSEQGGRRRIR